MNKNISNIVNLGDRICATLECNGRRLASVNGSNFNSLEAVRRALLDLAGRSLHAVFIRPHDEQFLRTAGEGGLHIATAGNGLRLDIPLAAFGDLAVYKL